MNIAFIPARCGSKAIKFKNIKEFCGKPLIYWSLLALENVDLIDKVYVATDCNEISSVVESFEFSKVSIYMRSEENSKDDSSTESVMLEFLNNNKLLDDDLFMLVQATSPMTTKNDFQDAISMYKNSKKDSLLSVVEEKKFFWTKDAQPVNYDYKNRPRRQDFEGFLLENGAFYINKVSNILRDKNRLSGDIALYIMNDYNSIDIDEELDWIVAEQYMKEHIL